MVETSDNYVHRATADVAESHIEVDKLAGNTEAAGPESEVNEEPCNEGETQLDTERKLSGVDVDVKKRVRKTKFK